MTDSRERYGRYYAATRTILLTEWDPIGVSQYPEAQDEYDSYVPSVISLLMRRVDRHSLFNHLWELETGHMGLSGTSLARQRTSAVVDRLLGLRNDIERE